jgi:hypothetical protein
MICLLGKLNSVMSRHSSPSESLTVLAFVSGDMAGASRAELDESSIFTS